MDLKEQLVQSKLDQKNIQRFQKSFQDYLQFQNKPTIHWENFVPMENAALYQELPEISDSEKIALIKQLVVCKLNGGLGTSMNCKGAKSSIIVKDEKSFLDITLCQHRFLQKNWDFRIPFLLMNSFYTEQITFQKTQTYQKEIDFYFIMQSCYPRLEVVENGYNLLSYKELGEQAFYPPGHGDIFLHLQENLLNQLLQQGKKYLFLSNIDNLGATVSFPILNYLQNTNCPFLIETVAKNSKDSKGGSLLKNCKTETIKLLETAEVETIPKQHWQSMQPKLTTFNTNNLWINLTTLQQAIQKPSWSLDLIKNYKNIAGKKILQLETTMGSAISNFPTAKSIEVGRDRFLPVKKTADLDLLRSDAFFLNKKAGYLLQKI